MTAVERTPHEPGPSSGYTDFSDTEQQVDWSELEREPKNTRNTQVLKVIVNSIFMYHTSNLYL